MRQLLGFEAWVKLLVLKQKFPTSGCIQCIVFWVVIQCGLVRGNQRLWEECASNLEAEVSENTAGRTICGRLKGSGSSYPDLYPCDVWGCHSGY
jgi:hypothetical protein